MTHQETIPESEGFAKKNTEIKRSGLAPKKSRSLQNLSNLNDAPISPKFTLQNQPIKESGPKHEIKEPKEYPVPRSCDFCTKYIKGITYTCKSM